MIEIELPDGTILEAPDGADPSAVAKAYLSKRRAAVSAPASPAADPSTIRAHSLPALPGEKPIAASPRTSGVQRWARGVNDAAKTALNTPGGFAGALDAGVSMARGAVAPAIGGIAGAGSALFGKDGKEQEAFAQSVADKVAGKPMTQSGAAQLGLLGAAVSPLETVAPALLPLAGSNALFTPKVRVPKERPAPIPTTAKLAEAAENAYAVSDAAGVVIRPESTARAANIFRDVANKENLGKLPPKMAEAVAVLDQRVAENVPMSLRDADKVRQLIGDAFKSTDAADRRLAKLVQNRYDRYVETLSPEDVLGGDTEQGVSMLKQARELYMRRKNSEMLDKMESRASRKGESSFTQAGGEHALRREFEKLADNEKKMRTLTPEQQQAITDVASKGSVMRNIGKLDPTTGGMGSLVSLGTGTLASALTGGVGGLAIPAAGYVARRLATKATKGRADKAREALVGRGLTNPATSGSAAGGSPATRSVDQIRAELRQVELLGWTSTPAQVRELAQARKRLQQELRDAEQRQ